MRPSSSTSRRCAHPHAHAKHLCPRACLLHIHLHASRTRACLLHAHVHVHAHVHAHVPTCTECPSTWISRLPARIPCASTQVREQRVTVRNVYTNDLNLSNEGSTNEVDGSWGEWTIQEGEENLYLLNRKNNKKYKFLLEEIE